MGFEKINSLKPYVVLNSLLAIMMEELFLGIFFDLYGDDGIVTSRVLYIFDEECAAVITMEHKLAYIEAKDL